VSLLPLFPLDLVLFPGASLPLHIFEPRYREMISECLDQKKSFGVVRAKEDGVAEIGCTAEIITVTQKYPDGRMDIVTEGAETESDAVELSQLGCEFAQGVAFGQPMTAAEARRLMGAALG